LRSLRLGRFGLVVWVVLLVGAGPAWATTGHAFVGEFGELGGGNGQFNEGLHNGPGGIAVMPSTGDVFTADTNDVTPRVQRFNAAGVFQAQFAVGATYRPIGAIAVDSAGSGAVYASVNRDPLQQPVAVIAKYSAAGMPLYELNASGTGTTLSDPVLVASPPVAVDPVDGSVYVTATDDVSLAPVIDRFDQSGAFVASFDGSTNSPDGLGFGCVSGLAVAPGHEVYVFDGCKGRVDRYDAAGAFEAPVDDGSDVSRGAPLAVAVDPTSGDVYVAEVGPLDRPGGSPIGPVITHFGAGGAPLVYTFDASNVGGIRAMAVGGDGTVYTSDASRPVVERFVRFAGPTVSTDPPTGVGARTATLNAAVSPEGIASSYHFEYGPDFRYGLRTAEVSVAGAGSAPIAVSTDVGDLDPNLEYHYRVVASNGSGSIVGGNQSLHTLPAPATLDHLPPFVSAITPRSARVHATINPNRNTFVNWAFEFGTTTAYGSTAVAGGCAFCGGANVPAVAGLSGLEPNTTYHFRLIADPDGLNGVQEGVDQTFITAPAAGGGARDVTTRKATLVGTIDPHGVATTYHFNYGLTSSYGVSTQEMDGGSGAGERAVSQPVSGLLPDTTYHVQVVANGGGVTRFGGDGLLRTAPAPTAVAISPIGVTTDSAVLAGDVDTHGMTGTYHFDVKSLDSSYDVSTAERPVAGGASVQRVDTGVGGLPAGETFVVAMTVSSNDAIQVSDLVTFATAPLPRVFPTAPVNDGTAAYGCGAPRLDAYNGKPRPGETITITGRDLGLGGSVVLGDRPVPASDWSASAFKVQVADDESGTLALTVDCGHRSNTIAVTLFHKPDNRFVVTRRSVTDTTATLTVRVPGPGKLQSSAPNTKAAKITVKRLGSATIKIKLSAVGVRALRRAKSHKLKVAVGLRYTPAGGSSASKTTIVTFTRKAGR
jgi:hypothetical protein